MPDDELLRPVLTTFLKMYDLAFLALKFFVLTVSLTIHELSHAWVALRLGDNTAERLGRVSFNPLVHMDVVGSFMILFGPFGWAKPVPVNPFNLKNPHTSLPLVSLAGPMSNVVIALVACVLLATAGGYFDSRGLDRMVRAFIAINFSLAIFNLLPIAPLDGSKIISIFMSEEAADRYEQRLEKLGIFPLLILMSTEFFFQPGLLEMWFRLWSPAISSLLGLLSLPASLYPFAIP